MDGQSACVLYMCWYPGYLFLCGVCACLFWMEYLTRCYSGSLLRNKGCVSMLLFLRAGVSPVLWLLEKHYIPSDQTLYCLYSVCTKESPRANGTDAKRTTTLKANILSWFSLKEKINLVLDISFCSFGLFFHIYHDSEVKIYIVDLSETCYIRCLFICVPVAVC